MQLSKAGEPLLQEILYPIRARSRTCDFPLRYTPGSEATSLGPSPVPTVSKLAWRANYRTARYPRGSVIRGSSPRPRPNAPHGLSLPRHRLRSLLWPEEVRPARPPTPTRETPGPPPPSTPLLSPSHANGGTRNYSTSPTAQGQWQARVDASERSLRAATEVPGRELRECALGRECQARPRRRTLPG